MPVPPNPPANRWNSERVVLWLLIVALVAITVVSAYRLWAKLFPASS